VDHKSKTERPSDASHSQLSVTGNMEFKYCRGPRAGSQSDRPQSHEPHSRLCASRRHDHRSDRECAVWLVF
jgi:hypothetical protein